MSVISKILELMEKNHISGRKLTTDLKLSNSCITEWKKEKAKPSLDAIIKIAKYFGVSTDYLLLEDKTETTNDEAADELQENDPGGSVNNPLSDNQVPHQKPERILVTAEVTADEIKLLECYKKLDEQDREYIRSKMIVLERESIV